jgi:hypothetical protein
MWKVTQNLNYPTCRSWGGDLTVMPRLYLTLLRSKIDYGNSVYGPATKFKLS